MSITLSTSARDVLCNAIVDQIDLGASDGTLEFYVDGFATLLATLTFSSTAFGASSNGVATANSITSDTSADDTGTVGVFQILNGESSPLLSGTCSASGGDINFNTTSINTGDSIAVTSLTVTVPAS